MRLNPDLVFGNVATGDVKYKLLTKEWNRSDLYQAVAFATGYRVGQAAVFTFSSSVPNQTLPCVRVGDVRLRAIAWDCSPETSPAAAAEAMVAEAASWLLGIAD
jgi:hypothetical protein